MSLKLYRPTPTGLEPAVEQQRAAAARAAGTGSAVQPQLAPTSNRMAVLFWSVWPF
jgi:hypothetical protein